MKERMKNYFTTAAIGSALPVGIVMSYYKVENISAGVLTSAVLFWIFYFSAFARLVVAHWCSGVPDTSKGRAIILSVALLLLLFPALFCLAFISITR